MTVQEELEIIRSRDGGILRPESVVDAAKNKASALHDRFNWDDTSAAHAWRLEQARHLIRVFVKVVGNGGQESRLFVALSSDKKDGGGYRILTDVLNDKEMRDVLLQDAYEDMRRFEAKYANLEELAGVFEAMRKTEIVAVVGRRG